VCRKQNMALSRVLVGTKQKEGSTTSRHHFTSSLEGGTSFSALLPVCCVYARHYIIGLTMVRVDLKNISFISTQGTLASASNHFPFLKGQPRPSCLWCQAPTAECGLYTPHHMHPHPRRARRPTPQHPHPDQRPTRTTTSLPSDADLPTTPLPQPPAIPPSTA